MISRLNAWGCLILMLMMIILWHDGWPCTTGRLGSKTKRNAKERLPSRTTFCSWVTALDGRVVSGGVIILAGLEEKTPKNCRVTQLGAVPYAVDPFGEVLQMLLCDGGSSLAIET